MALVARDIMQEHVVTVTPETTLDYLADLLIADQIGGTPVLEGRTVVGVVSRSDFVRSLSLERTLAALAAEADDREEFSPGEARQPASLPSHHLAELEGRTVRDVMSPTPVTVPPDAPIHEVADLFVKNHLHRLLVVDGTTLIGVISALDIVGLVATRRLKEA